MKILIAPDSFKGSLNALEVCKHIEVGIRTVFPDCSCFHIPMADGGEGTKEAFLLHKQGVNETVQVIGPNHKYVEATFAILDNNVAIMEMASASGLLLMESLDALHATSYGTGQMIKRALDLGCSTIYIGLGGSATNDGGVGMAQALGVSFKDENNNEIPLGSYQLEDIREIDISKMDSRLLDIEMIALCDVNNPLYGSSGATAVYGEQKGVTTSIYNKLENGLRNLALCCEKKGWKNNAEIPGAGAAGGMGFSLLTFFEAKIVSGIDTMMQLTELPQKVKEYDLIITGEGRLDNQSMNGKVIGGLAKLAKENKKPLVAIVGSVGKNIDELFERGLLAYESCVSAPCSLQEAMQSAPINVENASQRLMRKLQLGSGLKNI